jgi:hypothetical protein
MKMKRIKMTKKIKIVATLFRIIKKVKNIFRTERMGK